MVKVRGRCCGCFSIVSVTAPSSLMATNGSNEEGQGRRGGTAVDRWSATLDALCGVPAPIDLL